MVSLPVGRHFFRGDDGYEAVRSATVWHERVPDRYPDVIVQAVDADDVVATVRYAKANNKRVSIKSGGHSWAANHLRDGAVLLDVSRLEQTAIDPEKNVAVVGPGKGGSVLAAELDELGLFFPAGHCKGVRIGGYLLQGGYGWNSRVYGPACESVLGLDVVTADGEKLYIDADNHPDLYWAARGSGPGFFAVVTAFHLKLYPKPAVCANALYVYSADYIDEVYTWARSVGADVDRRVEFQILMSRAMPFLGLDEPCLTVVGPVFADSEQDAADALAFLETCPVREHALLAVPCAPTDLEFAYQGGDEQLPVRLPLRHRQHVDLGIGRRVVARDPGASSRPCRRTRRISSGSTGDLRPSARTWPTASKTRSIWRCTPVWKDAADDDKYSDWARSNMAGMEHLQTGVQLADENLGERPAKFMTDDNMDRLDRVRDAYDPDGRFHPWMGRL